ncbi:MAG: class I SAM-dependent methyltransferase [Phycisphaerales bacterium]|nr:class I SAM-dependent methyltransferase [Phycisphaerales bacterium]
MTQLVARACGPEAAQGSGFSDADGNPLSWVGDTLVDQDGRTAAVLRDGVVDFIRSENYSASFGYQWNKTRAVVARDGQMQRVHFAEMDLRTGFHERDLSGLRCLEIGAGLGDDTSYLLARGIGSVTAVDLSESIFRAARVIDDPRVRFVRADASRLPFPASSFDLVVCHRMMMHTPHPAATLARAARMVRPGGLLFAHSYHRSSYFLGSAKYKYRWLTTRLPRPLLWNTLRLAGPVLRWGTVRLTKQFGQKGADFAHRWSPWVIQGPHMTAGLDRRTMLARELQVSFDALTPRFDLPMYADDFVDLVEGLGFSIERLERRPWFPLWAVARKKEFADEHA